MTTAIKGHQNLNYNNFNMNKYSPFDINLLNQLIYIIFLSFLSSKNYIGQEKNIIKSRAKFLDTELVKLSNSNNDKIISYKKLNKEKYYSYIQKFIRKNYAITKKNIWDYLILNLKNEKI